ncbi:MAG: hypothetical protein ACLUOI_33840 [Eisenbergiella sp.]
MKKEVFTPIMSGSAGFHDVYLGGLDQEKFPLLFKRAIPFRMNIKLRICKRIHLHGRISILRICRKA